MVTIINTADIERMSNLSPDETDWVYNGLDCCVTLEILHVLLENLDEVSRNTYNFSLDLQAPVLEMQLRGTLIDETKWKELLQENKKKIKFLAGNLTRIFEEGLGCKINWRSPKQLCSLFYDVLGFPVIKNRSKTTGKYAPTTDREALEKLSQHFYGELICNHLLYVRDYDKQRSFLETPLDKDKRFRSSYNIAGTNTGRFSSSESQYETGSNAQNIAEKLRIAFRSSPKHVLVNLDLAQADARNVGAICWELLYETRGADYAGAYLDACESGDLHTKVCKLAWQDLDWIIGGNNPSADRKIADQIFYRENTYRDMAKKLGHGTNYLGTPGIMAMHTKMPIGIIRDFQNRYFEGFPCVKDWHSAVDESIRLTHYLQTTNFNRRRFFFGRPTEPSTIRAAVAYEPQSMTGDEINTGILQLWAADRVKILAQVHDNVLFECLETEVDEIVPWALEIMQVPIELKGGRLFTVPLDAKVGYNWGDTKYNLDGSIKANPDGLQSWKGKHTRTAPQYTIYKKQNLSLLDYI